jgi:uncharacterized protein YjaZ
LKYQLQPKKIIINTRMIQDQELMQSLKTTQEEGDDTIKLLKNKDFSFEGAMKKLQRLKIQTGAKETHAVSIRSGDSVRTARGLVPLDHSFVLCAPSQTLPERLAKA